MSEQKSIYWIRLIKLISNFNFCSDDDRKPKIEEIKEEATEASADSTPAVTANDATPEEPAQQKSEQIVIEQQSSDLNSEPQECSHENVYF